MLRSTQPGRSLYSSSVSTSFCCCQPFMAPRCSPYLQPATQCCGLPPVPTSPAQAAVSFFGCAVLNHPHLPSRFLSLWCVVHAYPSTWSFPPQRLGGRLCLVPGWARFPFISSPPVLLFKLVLRSCSSLIVTVLWTCMFHKNKNHVSLVHFCPGFLAHYYYIVEICICLCKGWMDTQYLEHSDSFPQFNYQTQSE